MGFEVVFPCIIYACWTNHHHRRRQARHHQPSAFHYWTLWVRKDVLAPINLFNMLNSVYIFIHRRRGQS